MKVILFALLATAAANTQKVNPIQKVVELLSALEAKILKDGEAEAKAYKEYFEWCDDASKNTAFSIKTATSKKAKLEATIAKAAGDIDALTASIVDLAASIATDEGDKKAATEIRAKEAADFQAAEAELMDASDTLGRAIGIIERNMKGSALLQGKVDTSSLNKLIQSLSVVIDAAAFSGEDKQKLISLVQSRQGSDDDDSELGAPAPDAYKSHSTGIVEVLEDMKEKADAQLAELRKAELNANHNYDLLALSLKDEIAASNHELAEAKAGLSEAEQTKAQAEGDLAMTTKDLAELQATLETCQTDCMEKASDHAVTVAGRKEELAALAQAKKIIQDMTGGAEGQTYSFLQTSSKLSTSTDLRNIEVISLLKNLAKKQHSTQLAQLASRISAVMKYGAGTNDDVFAKVKGLISEMIDRLLQEAKDEAGEKAYCDEEMAKTEQKRDELTGTIDKLSAKIDQATSQSVQLKAEVKVLQEELVALAKQQAEMDQIRADTKAAFTVAKADLEQGLDGVRQALKVLREFYQSDDAAAFVQQPAAPEKHEKSTGAGGGIIGMLEVIESDFAKNLAEEETEEASAQEEYERITQENKITKATKDQDVKYKTAEAGRLDKTVAELSSDREGSQTELDAVLEYYSNLRARCIAKPETYEERKRRREAEIAGLKEALTILEGEAVFLQKRTANLRRH